MHFINFNKMYNIEDLISQNCNDFSFIFLELIQKQRRINFKEKFLIIIQNMFKLKKEI